MNYEIKIENAKEKNGSIDIKRLALIAENILQVAYGSVQIRLMGISFTRGRMPLKLENTVQVNLSGLEKGSTVLKLEAKRFDETFKSIQLDAFKQSEFENLLLQTPVSLFIKSYQDALNEKSDKDYLDKPLINKMKNFEKVFKSNNETILFYNQESDPKLILKKIDFKKITTLERETPSPRKIILNGRVEVMEYSKRRVKLITDGGQVEAYISEKIRPEEIKEYWGHIVTISGIANYRFGGKLGFVEIEKIYKPSDSDKYFSKKVLNETTEQQIQRQIKEKGFKNNLSEIIGKLDVEENFEELLNMLTK